MQVDGFALAHLLAADGCAPGPAADHGWHSARAHAGQIQFSDGFASLQAAAGAIKNLKRPPPLNSTDETNVGPDKKFNVRQAATKRAKARHICGPFLGIRTG
jgi:hypothetical protein